MVQKINGMPVFVKAVYVPPIEEIEQAQLAGTSIEVCVGVYDGIDTESTGSFEILAIKNVSRTDDGGFSFTGKICNVRIAAIDDPGASLLMEADNTVILEEGTAKVTVDANGGQWLEFIIRMSFSFL